MAQTGVPASVKKPELYFQTNANATLNLLELCREFRIPKFVLASTSSLYGTDSPLPFNEEALTDRPLSPYSASKKAAETLCYTYHHLYGIDVSILRFFTVFGPGGRPDMSLFRFVQWITEDRPVFITGDGSQSRDFTYVDDIARGTIAAIKPLGYEIINLGSDHPLSILDAVQMIERILGKQATKKYLPRPPSDMPETWADVRKAKKLLGWSAQVSIEEGLRNTVSWYEANRHWAKSVDTDVSGLGSTSPGTGMPEQTQ